MVKGDLLLYEGKIWRYLRDWDWLSAHLMIEPIVPSRNGEDAYTLDATAYKSDAIVLNEEETNLARLFYE